MYKRYQEYEKVESKTGVEELFYNPQFIMEGMDENITDNISSIQNNNPAKNTIEKTNIVTKIV